MSRNWREMLLVCRLTSKRLLTRKNFWVILLLLPLLLFGLQALEKEDVTGLRAVIYCEEEALLPGLQEQSNPNFYIVSSVEEVKSEVLSGRAECGYAIYEGLFDAFADNDWYWGVEVYEGPESMFTELINEVLFSQIFEHVSTKWYLGFIEDKIGATGQDTEKQSGVSEKAYQELADSLAGEETFRVQTIRLGGNESAESFEGVESSDKGEDSGGGAIQLADSGSLLSSKGVVAAMLYLVSLLALLDVVKDREKRHFRRSIQPLAAFWTILYPVFWVGVSGLVALLLVGEIGGAAQGVGGLGYALGRYLLLLVMTTLYALALSLLVRKSSWMYGIMPVLFLASLVLCPVFVDLGEYIPLFGWIKWLFPLAFYV